ncbi:MAG: hypothetical protein HY905_08130 [Deltaproteobacteria bacterium]|nr:hypothetical protein [Deltaproteobacteria bacterium]
MVKPTLPPGALVPVPPQAVVVPKPTGSPALRREAEALVAAIEQHKARIGVSFYETGRALTALLDRKLYTTLGYATFAALVEGRKLMSRAFAWQLVAIFRSIPRETAQQLGPAKAFEWLRVLRLEAGPEAEPQDVRHLAGGEPQVGGQPVSLMTVNEIAEFRRRMQEREDSARHDPGAPEAHRAARVLAQYLQRIGAGDAEVAARFIKGVWRIRADLSVPAAQAVCGKKS